LILLNFSNRYLNLEPVLSRLVADAGLHALVQEYNPPMGSSANQASSNWVVIARNRADLGIFSDDPRWVPLESRGGGKVWTDDYSNILGVMFWRIDFPGLSAAWESMKP